MRIKHQYTVTIEQDGNGNLANELDSILNAELSHNHCLIDVEAKPNSNECSHIIGLISLEEDDEFVVAGEGDDMDWEAGNNTKFQFCPKCGVKL